MRQSSRRSLRQSQSQSLRQSQWKEPRHKTRLSVSVSVRSELLAAARQAHVHVVHITFGCYTVDGSDLEFMKQRAIGDDRSRLQEQSAPREYTP